jgi:signal transduction histidine kinase
VADQEARGTSKTEIWMAWVRVLAVPFAVLEVTVFKAGEYPYPAGYEAWALTVTAALAAGALLFLVLAYRAPRAAWRAIGFAALLFDSAIVYAYIFVYAFEPGTPIRALVYIPLVEAAIRYGLLGGLVLPAFSAVLLALAEWWRIDHFNAGDYDLDRVTFPVGIQLILGVVVGSLVNRLRDARNSAAARAAEAEVLRDELGRRADFLDATNRCARALSSSLEIEQAFAAFIRELRGLLPFDRTAILLAEDGQLRVFATAGAAAETVFPPGTVVPIAGSVMTQLLSGQAIYREDMTERRFDEEVEFVSLGLLSRVLAPLLAGPETIGAISVVRREPHAFSPAEIELLSLLGRLAGSAVQNIRAYESERTTAEELRRLSALRADFVSLVSHELRSPMASVIGSARTLQMRWRELSPEQRESFLALITHETARLADLIGDVLDTSRIEAGTFSYSFDDVDLATLVRDSAAAAERGQDEVAVRAVVHDPLPAVRGDRERLRQVLVNLIDNAVKYSPPGEEVRVEAQTMNGRVVIEVRDRGPGISPEHQGVIFEKFGRVQGGSAKPGTGLGLFIARSIAEAHGGSLRVRSGPDQGSTFTLSLPVGLD